MHSNFQLAIIILLLMAGQAAWFSAKFFIRKNGLKSYMLWHHFQDFVSLYKLSSKKYPADVNIKAKLYLIGIPLLIITMLIVFAIPPISSSSSSYSQKFDFQDSWIKEQIDEEGARSIIEANIDNIDDCFFIYFTGKKILDSKKYNANKVSFADKDGIADFFGKIWKKDKLWKFEVDQDSLKHVGYINGIVLVKNGEPAIALALTRNDTVGLPWVDTCE